MSDEMISLKLLLFQVPFLMLLPKNACVVPPDYCLHELNKSDCDVKPTPVFYYYKPGSRCEIATWRGCPTYNKFENEIECSSTCIYRLNIDFNFGAEANWEDEIKKLPKDDADKLNEILKLVLNKNRTTPSDEATSPTTDLAETTVSSTSVDLTEITTQLSEASEENEIITSHTTTKKVATEPTTEATITTEAKTTTTEATTISTETTEATQTSTEATKEATQPLPEATTTEATTTTETTTTETTTSTEATTTQSTTTVTTTKGDPDEVIVMKQK